MDSVDFIHTGPGTLAGQYMRRFWQPVFLSAELDVGQARPIRNMDEDFTLYRGESGTAHLVDFRCAHRGTQLSVGWVEGECIRCVYHGWMYESSGQCVEQPGELKPFAERIRIQSFPTHEYLGLVFAYLGDGAPPEFPRYPTMERDGVRIVTRFDRGCNYFQILENDPGHGHFLHSGRSRGLPYPQTDVEETEWGIKWIYRHANGTEQISHRGMPNVGHNMGPPLTPDSGWREFLMWTVPIDDATSVWFETELAPLTGDSKARFEAAYRSWERSGGRRGAPDLAAAVLAGELTLNELRQKPDIHVTNIEDDIAQIGQGVITDRAREHLGSTDAHVLLCESSGQWNSKP